MVVLLELYIDTQFQSITIISIQPYFCNPNTKLKQKLSFSLTLRLKITEYRRDIKDNAFSCAALHALRVS